MSLELTSLALACLLQVGQIMAMSAVVTRSLGSDWPAGPRDTPPPTPLSPLAGRLRRAMENHFEALILFGAAVLFVTLAGKTSPLTALCAWAYLTARVLYVPAYALGLTPGRSIIWGLGLLATVVMLLAGLL